jgi:hypothetical protein
LTRRRTPDPFRHDRVLQPETSGHSESACFCHSRSFGAGLSETVMKQFLRLNIRQKLVNYGSTANMIIYRR